MNNKKDHQPRLQLATIHQEFDHSQATKAMSFAELVHALEMIDEIERLNREISLIDREYGQNRYYLN